MNNSKFKQNCLYISVHISWIKICQKLERNVHFKRFVLEVQEYSNKKEGQTRNRRVKKKKTSKEKRIKEEPQS